ncbi:hypothetical protein O6P43_009827 [Quillaja saponaria]|uniref:Uncharacterized protein n=1 Tax=Quillaja saponaria TaxID=32244 RepID=A0AAD7VDP7_QUISA|nr:hypothetical protein O6P43_009827 [Quillaja saponaria]
MDMVLELLSSEKIVSPSSIADKERIFMFSFRSLHHLRSDFCNVGTSTISFKPKIGVPLRVLIPMQLSYISWFFRDPSQENISIQWIL